MKRSFDPSRTLLAPPDIIAAFTGKGTHELAPTEGRPAIISSFGVKEFILRGYCGMYC